MTYLKIKPCRELAPYIESIWCQEDPKNAAFQNYRPTKLLPSAKIDLLFHYGDPFIETDRGKRFLRPRSYIVGQKTRSSFAAATGTTGIIIVNFKPSGASGFLPMSLMEIQDRCIDLELIFNKDVVRRTEERIREAGGFNQRVAVVEEFLIRLINKKRQDELIVNSLGRLLPSEKPTLVTDIARDLNISRRQFIRRFQRTVGLNPKKFARILRFQKAIGQVMSGVDFTQVALDCGYYDQAHFINDFKQFGDDTPKRLLNGRVESKLSKFFNIPENTTQFYNTKYL